MPISDPLILAADVSLTPARELPPALRAKLGARRGDAALTRLRGRAPAKLVDRQGALLLAEFTTAKRVAEAIRACAARLEVEPAALLDEAFPLLRDCFNGRFLVPADSDEASPNLPTRDRGDRLGPYRVLRCLHVIEDTELYQARDDAGRHVAVKVGRPGVTRAGVFRREEAALAHLAGKGAPRLLGTGRHRRRPWLAMTWCEGTSPDLACRELRDHDDRARLLLVLQRIATAYAALHRRGVLHGDVHPRNLLLERGDRVRLVDFGLALPIPPLTLPGPSRRGAVPKYLAPEQAAGDLAGEPFPFATEASEQFAVGVLLYHLATGGFPVDHPLDRTAMLTEIATVPAMTFSRRGVPPWPALEAVLRRALALEPGARFPSMAAMARALAKVRVPATRRRRPAGVPSPAALEAVVDRFIDRTGTRQHGFVDRGRAPECSVMLGAAGTAFALYRIACRRDDGEILELADAWQRRVERATAGPLAFEGPDDGLTFDGLGPVSPFHAMTGVLVVRALIAIAQQDLASVRPAVAAFCEAAVTPWPRRDLTLGRMGAVLGCTMLIEALPATMTDEIGMVRRTGDRVLGQLWRELRGLGPIGNANDLEDHGVAHGWAGLIWATLRWRDTTGVSLPRGLRPRLAELADGAEPLGRGVHWAQRVTGLLPSVLATHQVAGWCNGPAGFVHLMSLADVHFPEPRHARLVEAAAWSTWEAPSEVFDLCCGLVGRAYALLRCYRHTADPEWLTRAGVLTGRAIDAFESVRPTLGRPLSLFKGEAGLAVLAADLMQPEAAAFPFFEPEADNPRHPHG